METHDGQIVEKIVRRSGISLAELARILNVNRRSIYNWFQQERLSVEIIAKIGYVLDHDFSNQFPDYSFNTILQHPEPVPEKNYKEINEWKNKYIELLERYNDLLYKQTVDSNTIDAA